MTAAPAELQPAHVLDRAALKAARRAAGLTLRQVGAVIGYHWTTVGKYEDPQGIDIPASALGALAAAYRVNVGTFFTDGDR